MKKKKEGWNHINSQWETQTDQLIEVKTSVLLNATAMEMHPAIYIAKLKQVQKHIIQYFQGDRLWWETLAWPQKRESVPLAQVLDEAGQEISDQGPWAMGCQHRAEATSPQLDAVRLGAERDANRDKVPPGAPLHRMSSVLQLVRTTITWPNHWRNLWILQMPVILRNFKYVDSLQKSNFLKHYSQCGLPPGKSFLFVSRSTTIRKQNKTWHLLIAFICL